MKDAAALFIFRTTISNQVTQQDKLDWLTHWCVHGIRSVCNMMQDEVKYAAFEPYEVYINEWNDVPLLLKNIMNEVRDFNLQLLMRRAIARAIDQFSFCDPRDERPIALLLQSARELGVKEILRPILVNKINELPEARDHVIVELMETARSFGFESWPLLKIIARALPDATSIGGISFAHTLAMSELQMCRDADAVTQEANVIEVLQRYEPSLRLLASADLTHQQLSTHVVEILPQKLQRESLLIIEALTSGDSPVLDERLLRSTLKDLQKSVGLGIIVAVAQDFALNS